MLKKLTKIAVAATTILAGSGAANAFEISHLESNGTGTGPIEVISENGTSWTKIQPADLTLPVKVTVGSTTLDLNSYLIRQNDTTIGSWIDAANGPGIKNATHSLTGSTSNFTSEKQAIINLCNDKLNVGQGIHQNHTFDYDVPLTLHANFFQSSSNFEGNATVGVEVVCKAAPTPPPPDTASHFMPPVKFQIKDIQLDLTDGFLFPGEQTSTATYCKNGVIDVHLKASKPGNAKFKLWKKIDGVTTSEVIEILAKHDGYGSFEAKYQDIISVNKPTYVQAKAEEMVGLGLDTPWKDITLQCDGAGANYTPDLSNFKTTGSLVIGDTKGDRCPRLGEVGFSIKANYSTPIDYQLVCNGINQSGTLQTAKSGDEWKATGKVIFQTKESRNMICVLRHIRDGKITALDLKGKQFTCKPPIVNTASGDLVHDTIPVEPVIPMAQYTGELTLADSANAERDSCPREGQAVFKINSNQSADVPYTFVCSNGKSWEGNMAMFSNGPGKYQGTAAKTFPVNKTENVACVLKRVKGNNAYLLSAAAKQYNCVKSTGASASNDLVPDTNRPDDDIPQGQTLKGDFAFVDHGAPKCPRTGKALVTFKSPKSDNIHWSLDCKFQNKSGVVATQPNPAGGYMAATLVSLDVTKTVDESCTLRTVAPYNPKDHVTKAHQFVCATPSGHSASNDVQVPSNPSSDKPDVPATLVPAVPHKVIVGTGTSHGAIPPWQCLGGTWHRQKGCICPPHKKPIYGPVNYHGKVFSGFRCVLSGPQDKTTAPGSNTPDSPQVTIACKDKERRVGGKCVKIPGVSIHCKPGYHQEGKECVRNPVKGVSTVDKAKSDAIKRRLEAAKKKKAAALAAAAKDRKLKAAIAKRKLDIQRKKNAEAALKVRKAKIQQQAIKKALARKKAIAAQAAARSRAVTVKKRAAPRRTAPPANLQLRSLRRR